MPYTDTNPRIYYETSGDPADRPVVLISGLSAQLIHWRQGFVDLLVARGMFVIQPDNRDIGLSDKLGGPDDLGPAYGIADMAGDICNVLDALSIEKAHIVGQSMGGAIAQSIAIHHPDRVQSLVLIYTAPVFTPEFVTEEILEVHAGTTYEVLSREGAIADLAVAEGRCASTGFPYDAAWITELGGLAYDRCYRPDGIARQGMALLAQEDHRPHLEKISVPTAIIHGNADRLIKYEGGLALARAIKGAELHIYAGMGHEVNPSLWNEFVDIIMRTAAR